jgi:hypothetical protein
MAHFPSDLAPRLDTYVLEHGFTDHSEAIIELVRLGLGLPITNIEEMRIRSAVRLEIKRTKTKIRDLLFKHFSSDEYQDRLVEEVDVAD